MIENNNEEEVSEEEFGNGVILTISEGNLVLVCLDGIMTSAPPTLENAKQMAEYYVHQLSAKYRYGVDEDLPQDIQETFTFQVRESISEYMDDLEKNGMVERLIGEDGNFYYSLTDAGQEQIELLQKDEENED